MNSHKAIIWQIHDEKPGHQNQLHGLSNALAELRPVEIFSLRAPSRRNSLGALWSKRFPLGRGLPAPDLILGAGHATHLAVLAARRAYGGRAIVLMKPSLPPALFDLCLIPAHDRATASDNVVTTQGVLNVIRPTQQRDEQAGLLLIGGPSTAHGWSDNGMLDQIISITSADSTTDWQLATSRRTPPSFVPRLSEIDIDNLHVTPHQQTSPDWLPEQLARAAQVWVSEDSVSMVYEALTSGAAVGALDVPNKRRGRVAAGMEKLIDDGWATRFASWQPGRRLVPPPQQLDEARRCAEIVCRRFLSAAAA